MSNEEQYSDKVMAAVLTCRGVGSYGQLIYVPFGGFRELAALHSSAGAPLSATPVGSDPKIGSGTVQPVNVMFS